MKYDVRISGKTRTVELKRDGTRWQIALDGAPADADAIEIGPGIFSILLNGQSHEIRVAPNPDGSLTLHDGPREFEAEGRQQIVAPMPGKVIRLLVKPGDKVEAGQGLLVVEAMKMQNEVKSPKTGTVEKLLAKESQAVNAGDILAWID